MRELDCREAKVHVLVCTNERPPEKSCCRKVGGQEFYQNLKTRIKESGLHNTHWVTRTGCLGFCNDTGTTVTVYRRNEKPLWFTDVIASDADLLWKEMTRE